MLQDKWIEFAVELQSLAQAGLAYGKDVYDLERYTRIREIAAEMIACKSDIPLEKVKNLFISLIVGSNIHPMKTFRMGKYSKIID